MLAMIPVLGGGVTSSSLLSTTTIEGLKPFQLDDSLEEGEGFFLVGCSSRFKAAMACSAARLALSREPALEWFEDEAEWSAIFAAVVGVVSAPGVGLEKEDELSAGDNGDIPLLLAEEYNVGTGLRVETAGVNNGDDSNSCSCSNRDGNDVVFDGFLAAAGGGFFWGVSWVKSTHNDS
jgi:hypothetical protein